RLAPVGEPVQIAENVPTEQGVTFSVSENGTLAFRGGTGAADVSKLTWFDRAGAPLGTVGDAGLFGTMGFSPDRYRLTGDRIDAESHGRHMWTMDARGIFTRPIFDRVEDYAGQLSSDGRLAFTSGND